jgi:hypothetical protein
MTKSQGLTTKQARMLNTRMTETANEHGLEHWSPWCFGFVWSLVIGAWSLGSAELRKLVFGRSLGVGIVCVALLAPCGCGKEPPVEVQPQSGLERAKVILNDYASGAPLGSEAMTFEEIVAEVRQTDPQKATILEKGFADIERSPQNRSNKARALLKQL